MKVVNIESLICNYGYSFKDSTIDTIEGFVKIYHSYDIPKRKLSYGNKNTNTFCEAEFKISISWGAKEGVIVKILEPGFLLRGEDNHIYDDWSCCICAPQDNFKILKSQYLDIEKYYTNFIVPFFYNQTYHSTKGQWILGEYSHGDAGVIERYAREINPTNDFTLLTISLLSIQIQIKIIKQFNFGNKETKEFYEGLKKLTQNLKKILPFNFKHNARIYN